LRFGLKEQQLLALQAKLPLLAIQLVLARGQFELFPMVKRLFAALVLRLLLALHLALSKVGHDGGPW
jgi:hypothetical protein